MLEMSAFEQVTAVKLVAAIDVQNADANTEAPTQLVGKCQLSGIALSEFLEPQREAFKSAMAASSGATKDQVVIFAHSGRRHLLRRQLLPANNAEGLSAGDLLVEFAIIIERDSDIFLDLPSEEQGLSAPVIGVITICSTFATLILAGIIVVFGFRKCAAKRARIASAEDSKHDSKIEMTVHDKKL